MIPRLTSGWPKVAERAARRTSQAIAISQPPPNASPLTAAIVVIARLLPLARERVDALQVRAAGVGVPLREGLDVRARAEQRRVGRGEHHRPRAAACSSSQAAASASITSGESELAGGLASQTTATSPRRSSLTGAVAAGERVRVEALAGLHAEPALGEQPAQDHRRLGSSSIVSSPCRVGAREHAARPRRRCRFSAATPSSSTRQASRNGSSAAAIRAATKPVGVGAADRRAADLLGEVGRGLRGLGRGVVALDDLDDARAGGVEADDLVRPQRDLADLGDRELGGARGQDREAGRGGVELGEDRRA